MIEDLDEVFRQLLIRELPIKNSEVEVRFDQPKREWSARISKPTLNLFLYDARENQKLRQTQPIWDIAQNPDGTVTKRRKPVRVDLHYMITAWASEAEDEHRLLSRTMMALFRFAHLPEELLPESFGNQPKPVPIMVAQYDELRSPHDIWSVLDNEMRPALACIVTLALDPYTPTTTPLVRTRELRIGPSPVPRLQRLEEGVEPDRFWTIGGTLRSGQPLDAELVRLVIVERQLEGHLLPEGRFTVGPLEAGEYTLEVTVDDGSPRHYPISVPAADYDLEI